MISQTNTPLGESAQNEPVLALQEISKDFGSVRVLHNVSFDLQAGEVHALVGENGAGKSTLMKILSGYLEPSEGKILREGQSVHYRNSADAEAQGVVLIHQELNLAADLSVEENIFLGQELHQGPFVQQKAMQNQAKIWLNELECDVSPQARVKQLSVSEKQMVEIAKAMSRNCRILVMDEPTDVLTQRETDILFALIRRLSAEGVAIVFISHKLDEVKAIADRVTVLRDGRHVSTQTCAALSPEDIATLMVGRELSEIYPPKLPLSEEVVFSVEHVSVASWAQDVSFELHKGEILGFAGLVGAGRTELIEGILGLRSHSHGRFLRKGELVTIRNLEQAKRLGIAYLSEDRKGKGLLVDMPLRPNVTLLALEQFAQPFLNHKAEQGVLEKAIADFDIRVPNMQALVKNLSGGNQQKLVLAKIMEINPEIIILDEPTRGVDVGTKQQIYAFIHKLTQEGRSCIVISSEMPEIIGLCHRVIVMRGGVITGVLEGEDIHEQEIVRYATGLKGGRDHAA